MQATFIRDLDDFAGNAGLYQLDPPMEYEEYDDELKEYVTKKTEYVVVSPAVVMFSGPETYIFPSNENGEIVSWGELNGSYRGGLDRIVALTNAGYKVN